MSNSAKKGTALVTGASSGIGAVYADRLAKAGYDLILVARNADRLAALAKRLSGETGRSIETVTADLTNADHLAHDETRLYASLAAGMENPSRTSTERMRSRFRSVASGGMAPSRYWANGSPTVSPWRSTTAVSA